MTALAITQCRNENRPPISNFLAEGVDTYECCLGRNLPTASEHTACGRESICSVCVGTQDYRCKAQSINLQNNEKEMASSKNSVPSSDKSLWMRCKNNLQRPTLRKKQFLSFSQGSQRIILHVQLIQITQVRSISRETLHQEKHPQIYFRGLTVNAQRFKINDFTVNSQTNESDEQNDSEKPPSRQRKYE